MDLFASDSITKDEILAQRDRVLASPIFNKSKRQSDFLNHIVDAALKNHSDRLKEYSLAVDVFEKDSSFDPGIDSIVRVEASRLRSKLREYYSTLGKSDEIRIEVPKGHYAPVFTRLAAVLDKPFTPHEKTQSKKHILTGLAAMGAAILIVVFIIIPIINNSNQTLPISLQPELVERSIAVLPFRNGSSNTEDAFFVDGIQEAILSQLSRLSFFEKVISRTSMEQYRETTKTMPVIAGELGVEAVLQGSVQRAGNRVRISVQLIDAINDRNIWSESYDSELTVENLFAIQEQTAIQVANALEANLSLADESILNSVPTSNMEALEVYFKAKQHMDIRSSEDIELAISEFELATILDPDFALAHVGIADANLLRVVYEGVPISSISARIQSSIDQALQLNGNLGEAYVALGYLRYFEEKLNESETALKRALDLQPGYAPASHRYADTLRDMGRFEEALLQQIRAVTLDPRSAINNTKMSFNLSILGRFEEALLFAFKAIDVEPLSPGGYATTADHFWFASGQLGEAARWYSRLANIDANTQRTNYYHAQLLWDIGDAEQAECWVNRNFNVPRKGVFAYRGMQALALRQGDLEQAAVYAREGYRLNFRHAEVLATLRDLDLKQGNFGAARERYLQNFPDLIENPQPVINFGNYIAAVDIAKVLQNTGEMEQARRLLNESLSYLQNNLQRMGGFGYWIKDVEIYALLGQNEEALAALREAIDANWRTFWWTLLIINPNLDSISQDVEFQAMVQEIQDDVSRQLLEYQSSGNTVNVCNPR